MHRTHVRPVSVFVGLALLLAASPLVAQDRSLFLFGATGQHSSFRGLDAGRSLEVEDGLNLAGGLGIQMNDYFAIRGNVELAHGDLGGPAAPATGASMDRSYFGIETQIRYPLGHGLVPYMVGGGGVMALRPEAPDLKDATKPAGRVGAGLSFELPVGRASLFVEGIATVYGYVDDPLRPDPPTQVDGAWRTGLQYYIR